MVIIGCMPTIVKFQLQLSKIYKYSKFGQLESRHKKITIVLRLDPTHHKQINSWILWNIEIHNSWFVFFFYTRKRILRIVMDNPCRIDTFLFAGKGAFFKGPTGIFGILETLAMIGFDIQMLLQRFNGFFLSYIVYG
jgi:hypothetical protein